MCGVARKSCRGRVNASRDRLRVLTTTIELPLPAPVGPGLHGGHRRRTAPVTAPPTVLVVFGTGPEAIKMLPVVAALEASERFRPIVCSTGQHRDLVSPVLALFGRQADRDLAVMTPGQSLAGLTARVLTAVAETIAETRPDLVLVHGDTTTALAAAMAAFYARVPVGHVEAGLRSLDLARAGRRSSTASASTPSPTSCSPRPRTRLRTSAGRPYGADASR